MGCGSSCAARAPTPRSQDQGQTPSVGVYEETGEETDRARELAYRRQMFVRTASSSTSSLTSSAMLLGSSRKKKKNKKRTFAPLTVPSEHSNYDGSELSKSIIGEVSGILNVDEVIGKLIREDPASNPPPILPVSPPPHANRSASTMSRFLARKAPQRNEEVGETGMTPNHLQDDTPGTHRRQLSNENFFSRLPSTAALTGHKRSGSIELLNMFSGSSGGGPSGTTANGLITSQNNGSAGNSPFVSPQPSGDYSSTVQHLQSAGSAKDLIVMGSPPPPHTGHRRQGSESSMFSRIVRVSSLTAATEPEPPIPVATHVPSCSTKTLKAFLERENKDREITEEELEQWKAKRFGVMGDDRWTFQQVQEYLFSVHNQAKDVKELQMGHDMSRPITEYFVSTSHNTYLFGGQWITTGSRVDLQMYSKALKQGCRCVEIDVYDGSDGDPIVTHVSPAWSGGSVTFLEVCALIAKEAFKDNRSNSPIILNLENNMSKQSKRAAEILTGAFGSRLVRVDDAEFGWKKDLLRHSFPSPAQLAGRVLCRSKPKDSSEEYQNLIYFRNSPWRFTNTDEFARRKYYQTSSLPENKVKGAMKKVPADISPVELNRAFLNRVYPRSSAYASQNYNPLAYWLLGFQLVALNFQTEGLEMDLNRCMFERNNGSGFAIKPSLMRKARQKLRMTGGVRMSSRSLLAPTTSVSAPRTPGHLIRPFGISTGGLALTPSHGDSSPASGPFFSSRSLNLARFSSSRALNDTGTGGAGVTSPPTATSPLNPANNVNNAPPAGEEVNEIRPLTSAKSFMGVVEEALKNQNEDEEINEDEDDLPPPPPLMEGSVILPPLSDSEIDSPSLPQLLLPSVKKSLVTAAIGGNTDLSTLSPRSDNASLLPSGMRPLSHTSGDTYSDSPDLPTKSLVAHHHNTSTAAGEGSSWTDRIRKGHSSTLLNSRISSGDANDPGLDEEKRTRRLRARRRSTGSILKGPSEGGDGTTTNRKRSLEDAGASSRELVQSPSSPFLQPRENPFFEDDESEEKVALNSVLIQFISLKCNVNRERLRSKTAAGRGTAPSVSSMTQLSANNNNGAGDPNTRRCESEDDLSVDEEVYVELVVDGHPLDRMEKRTMGTVQLRGTQAGLFLDTEEVAAVLKDSETALFTLRLVDAWELPSSSGQQQYSARRSFFAHSLLPGTREIVLLGDSGPSGYPVPYTLTCKISTMYSIFSRSTGRFELEEKVAPPVLSCPSKTSMIHCVVVACRSENPRLKMAALDPFVSVQVLGIPTDSRELRTPKATRANPSGWNKMKNGSANPSSTGFSTNASSETLKTSPNPRGSSLNLSSALGGGGGSNATPGSTGIHSSGGPASVENLGGTLQASLMHSCSDGNPPDSVSWMFPLVFTFTWSEFAFLRFCLRSNVNVDPETGAVFSSMSTSSSRRRGSLVFRSNPTPTNASQSAAGGATGGPSVASSSVVDPGSVVGKNMLWADAIRSGYRSIPLYLEKNPDVHVATLLCHFTVFDARDQTFGPDKSSTPVGADGSATVTPPKPAMYPSAPSMAGSPTRDSGGTHVQMDI